MRNLLLLFILVFAIFWIYSHNKSHRDVSSPKGLHEVKPAVSKQSDLQGPSLDPRKYIPDQRVAEQPKPPPEANPYQVDRYSLRNLDLPGPKSVAELVSHLTDYRDPILPNAIPNQEKEGDGSVLSYFRGYVELANGRLARCQLQRSTSGVSFTLETAKGTMHEWSEAGEPLKLKNFKDDPYSLVLLLAEKRIAYLKFHPQWSVPGLQHSPRVMIGWILSNQTEDAIALRLALTEFQLPEFEIPGSPGEYQWPTVESIQAILPVPLPHK